MGATQPLQLQAVLEEAQEAVGRREVRPVVAADVAAVRQRPQRVERRTRAQCLVGAPVHELEQLHRELDVAQAARSELELPGPLVGADVLLDAPPHGLHVADEVRPARGAPHHRRDGLGVRLAQLRVARDGPGLEQRLELPGLGPPLVVGDVAVEGAHERALTALGAQVGVHLEAGLAQDPHHPACEPGGGGVGGLRDEHDVDVADVVQLVAAALAHGDDREPARIAALVVGELGDGDGQRRPQRGGGEVRQPGRDVLDVQHRQLGLGDGGEVGGREHHQLVAVGGAQRLDGGRSGELCSASTRCACRRCVRDRRRPPRAAPPWGPRRPRVPIAQPVPAVGVQREVVGERRRAPEQGEQPAPQPHLGAQRRVERRPVREGGDEPLHGPQREIRVGTAGQRPHDLLSALRRPVPRPPAQLRERALRPRLGQPQAGEGGTGARHALRSCPIPEQDLSPSSPIGVDGYGE